MKARAKLSVRKWESKRTRASTREGGVRLTEREKTAGEEFSMLME